MLFMTRQDGAAAQPGDPPNEDSARRAELVAGLIEYSAQHGLSDMSLRPLAAAVGSSPRMLLYFFGSKEGLIREILMRSRDNQMILAEQWLQEAGSPAERVERLWQWLADPSHAGIERLFFESYARSLHDDDGAWRGFGEKSVHDWLPVIDRLLRTAARPSRSSGKAVPTFILATLRGLLIDLLATGNRARVGKGFAVLAGFLRAQYDT
jgi:AcrR family transcriptional regulator